MQPRAHVLSAPLRERNLDHAEGGTEGTLVTTETTPAPSASRTESTAAPKPYLCLESRDQPSRGPAVARTPPLLNSVCASPSRLKELEWLLFSLRERHATSEQRNRRVRRAEAAERYLPKNLLKPLDFFLVSGEDGRRDPPRDCRGGTPAKSRCSVALRSASAVKVTTRLET